MEGAAGYLRRGRCFLGPPCEFYFARLLGYTKPAAVVPHNMAFTLRPSAHRCRLFEPPSVGTISVVQTRSLRSGRCRKNLPLCDLSDLESNPYQTPTNNNAVDAATSSPRHSPVRFWLYCHLAALCVTGVFSLVDSRIIQLPNASIDVIQWLIFPSLAALFVCPIAILVCILRPTVIPSQRLAIVVLETIVVLAHLFALLPAVQ